MRRPVLNLLWILGFCVASAAQQLPVMDNYLFNPVSVSPAFTGKYYKFQSVLTYRHESTNLAGAPITGNLQFDGSPTKNMGIGGNVLFNKAAIYQNISVNLNYAYHLQLATDHFLSFGINASFYNNYLNLSELVVRNPTDPMINDRDKISESYFNVGLGFLYNWKDLNFCISFPLLFNNRSFYNNEPYKHVLAMDRNWLIYANYNLLLHSDWKLQFDVLYRQNQYNPWTLDVSALVKFRDNYWLGALYRKPGTIGITAGVAIIGKFLVNYNFEFSGASYEGAGGGTHEISLGYRMIGETKKNYQIRDYAR